MGNRLANNIFSAAWQAIIQTVVLIVLYRYLAFRIGVDQLGIWSVVLATASSARISELGFGGSIVKFVANYRARGDDQAAAECLQTAAISVGALSIIMVLIAYPLLLLALPYVLPAEGLETGLKIMPYGLVSLLLTSVAGIWMNAIDACLQSRLRAAIMIVGSIIFLLSSIAGVELFGLVGLAAAQVVQGVILVTVGWVVVRKVMPNLPLLPQQWEMVRFREMLGYGINFQINTVALLLFEPATKILISRFGGLYAAGYFEMAEQMVVKVRAFVVESNRVIVPVYAGMTSSKNDALSLYIRNTQNLLFITIPLFAAMMALTPVVCRAWIGSLQPQFIIMGVWITCAWFLNTVFTPAYFAYLGQGKLRWITMSHIVMSGVNILAGMLLGNIFGWQGVLASFVCALILGSLIPVWAYHREHKIKILQILSAHDIISAVISLGSTLIFLSVYLIIFEDSLLNRWTHITVVTFMITIVPFTTFWFHPLRRKLTTMTITR
jgi:O-antigen/teichoic acid export membrane protein